MCYNFICQLYFNKPGKKISALMAIGQGRLSAPAVPSAFPEVAYSSSAATCMFKASRGESSLVQISEFL